MRELSTWPCLALASLTLSLANCSWRITSVDPSKVQTLYHEVDEHATVVPAKYGREYTLNGNMVARYQDFDLALVKTVHVPKELATRKLTAGSHYFYEIRNHEGFLLATFQINPETKEENSTVKINRYEYHFAPGHTPGSVIIFLPYDQMAAHSTQFPDKQLTHI
ncbi:hypothetical protein Rhal01_00031 [Rubritalea halochordaticola]|uniref:Uncharacterized protein n=1 Tax=Rubritalea halochordaticola TaxID=714537 RepID=A0ABP9UWZ2_9BACT